MRDFVLFIASLAGAAILTALAILIRPESPIWKGVLWGGIAIFIACACIILIDYFRPNASRALLCGIGIGITLAVSCSIALFQIDAKTEEKELGVFLQCDMTIMPPWMPPDGGINILHLSPAELAKGGRNAVFARQGGRPGAEINWPQSGRMHGRTGYLCQITNYENFPLLDVAIPLKITFRKAINNPTGGAGAGEITLSNEWVLSIMKLDSGTNNTFVLHLINDSHEFVDIVLPERGAAYKLGDTKIYDLRIEQPVNVLDRLPMVFAPFVEPVAVADPVPLPKPKPK